MSDEGPGGAVMKCQGWRGGGAGESVLGVMDNS